MNRTTLACLFVPALCITSAFGQFDIDDPERWALVTHRDNPAYGGNSIGELAGRGSVPYEFRISKLEVSTGDWLEFVHTFSTMSDEIDELLTSQVTWGVRVDFSYQGPGNRYIYIPSLDHPERAPISVSWRQAAMYCNWLHNGKSADPSTIHSGAYDTSTFGRDGSHWTDQSTRSCDAKFWIPSLDEYLKAAHFDPDKNGQGPGWWEYGHSSDDPPVQGLPGVGHTIMGLTSDQIGNGGKLYFPLGSYDDVISPWGLYDIIGGSQEWTEEWRVSFGFNLARFFKPSSNTTFFDPAGNDQIADFAFSDPRAHRSSLRICAAVSDARVDLDLDGRLTFFDVSEFITRYIAGSLSVDLDCDGSLSPSDIERFIELYHE